MDNLKNILIIVLAVLTGYVISRALSGNGKGNKILHRVFGTLPGDARRAKRAAEREEKKKAREAEKNSSRNDVLDLVSMLLSTARQIGGNLVYPGALTDGVHQTSLIGILVTKRRIIGINVFGFGGNVQADRETGPWKQTMNGETKQIPNPLERCQEQKKQLEGILESAGLSEIPVTVLPVFTSKTVVLTGYLKGRCYRSDDLKDTLTREEYAGDGPVAVKETGKKLQAMMPQKDKKR
ncbi:MAG: hypothetical protein IJ123_09555 [Blautia sp.]|nr:hypothetical protein [Blautia sp.]